jgi:enoyl-CoA hydratase/carnithine racemase
MSTLPIPLGFQFELNEGIGLIRLNRPQRLNALTFEIYQELGDFFECLRSHDEVRVIVLTGEGRAFCSGGDVEDIIEQLFSRDMKGLLEFTRTTGRLIEKMRALEKPIIGAINGVAVGAGAVMSIACDLRLASEKAKFGFIFPQVGLCGADMGATYLLPRIVGLGQASELLFTGDIIRAPRALEIGLVNHVYPADTLMEEALALAKKLSLGPAFAHSMTKKMIETEVHMNLAEAIEAEAQAQAICMQHSDFKEANAAWNEKRPPCFEGSPYESSKH